LKASKTSRYVLYTAALPAYRRDCLEVIEAQLGDSWTAFAGSELSDKTVQTELPDHLYHPVTNHHWLGGRLLFQWGSWREAIRASTLIADLNPRSVTAWCLLITRKILRRRTLLWGHLDPRKGPNAATARLRSRMRSVGDGSIFYSYENRERARLTAPREPIWVAPNALYRKAFLGARTGLDRNSIIYVGRLEPEKQPSLLLEGFALIAASNPDWTLRIVGDGTLRPELEKLARSLGLIERIRFAGAVYDAAALSDLYANAFCSVSPGVVGLSLTQSLGFGVPMVIAAGLAHGPEFELARAGAAVFFQAGSAADLAKALQSPSLALSDVERQELAETVRREYSAEAMAQGFVAALMHCIPVVSLPMRQLPAADCGDQTGMFKAP
jgi:glycosyltransferase involved in cell wall biosynthesis